MLDALYDEKVTLRRPSARDSRNKSEYVQVLDEGGGAIEISCRIERNARRVFNTDGVELVVDATMAYRADLSPELKTEDIIVTKSKETFKVLRSSKAKQLFSKVSYGRAELALTRTQVPEDVHG